MGQQIASGLDNKIDALLNLAATDVGFANDVIEVAEALKAANNSLGTAALANTGTTAGNVPILNNAGKIADGVMNSTATGGSAGDSGKLVALGAAGTIAATMIAGGGGGGGGGLKDLKFWSGNRSWDGTTTAAVDTSPRRWVFNTSSLRWNRPTGVTSILVIACGGGGSGCYAPLGTGQPNPDGTANTVSGRFTRKGGGGASGSSVIALITSPAAFYEVKIGRGGQSRSYGQDSTVQYGGGSTTFGTSISAGGGLPGSRTGNGGTPRASTGGNANLSAILIGGQGHDGTDAVWGGGSGGSSLFGGGYSGGGGVGVPNAGEVNAAPGAGGGAAHGVRQDRSANFGAAGHAGNDGCLLVLSF